MEDQSLQVSSLPPRRERVGLIVHGSNAAVAVKTIVAAEAAGVRQIWMAQPPVWPDVLTMLAAASNKNIYSTPRNLDHTNLSTSSLGPSSGASSFIRSCTWSIASWNRPQSPLYYRRYLWSATENAVSPSARISGSTACSLWHGKVDRHGHFYNVIATLPRTSQIPILISTLGKSAFQLAGQIADGALTWVCPVPYLLNTGIPALRTSAARSWTITASIGGTCTGSSYRGSACCPSHRTSNA